LTTRRKEKERKEKERKEKEKKNREISAQSAEDVTAALQSRC
jgi:hypothetical protein